MKLTTRSYYEKLSDEYSPLILLAFIGNIEVGNDLIGKIINYKNIETFNVSFCFQSKIIYEHFREIINKNFQYFSIYFTNEYGTDIQPTLFMYNDISKKNNFKYIIKLHTKSIKNEYNDLTNFVLTNSLDNLKKKLNKNMCNCVGPDNYYLTLNNDIFNKRNVSKNINLLNINKCFVRGTIFFTDHETFSKVIDFIKNNDFKSYIFNNLYENNSINLNFSPTHFLERVFGIIK